MMYYVTLSQLLALYEQLMRQSGGYPGIRDLAALESAIAQPRQSFFAQDLYPTIAEKAAILGFALIRNHAFVDGNKHIGHAAMEVFLVLNGWELQASVDEQEAVILRVAAGQLDRLEFTQWVTTHCVPIQPELHQ